MRSTVLVAVLSAAAAVLITPAVAVAQTPDLSGAWTLTWETPRGEQTIELTLVQSDATFTGTATMRMGEAPVKDGVVDGETVTFSVEMTVGRPGGDQTRTITQAFEGVLKDGTVEGEVTMAGMGGRGGGGGERRFPFTMKRVEG